jgi:Outer membrane lipoprotein-sorting protein
MRSPLPVLPVAAIALLLLGAAEDSVPTPSDGMSGRDVYACVLRNRFHAYVQEARLVSGDGGETAQESRLRMTWKSFRDGEDKARAGVLSKTLVRYEHPFDLRFSGYLVINNEARSNDQFVYLAASRRIRRVNLRKEAVFGTDFTFEDIVPAEIEDADYRRLSDAVVVYVPRENCVPVRTRYWDEKGVEVKELTVPYESVKDYDGIHWPMQLTMRNLRLETFTTLTVEKLEPNAKLPDKDFEVRRLMSH